MMRTSNSPPPADAICTFGVGGIAQVDLGRRTHRHHRHDTLGLMAVQVLAAAERRRLRAVESSGVAPVGVKSSGVAESVVLTQFARHETGFAPVTTPVGIGERPPAASC